MTYEHLTKGERRTAIDCDGTEAWVDGECPLAAALRAVVERANRGRCGPVTDESTAWFHAMDAILAVIKEELCRDARSERDDLRAQQDGQENHDG